MTALFDHLATLLGYPREHYLETATAAAALAATSEHGEAAEQLRLFSGAVEGLDLDTLEELYTRTFDLNPMCALEVGWHLYGEQYERGRFLVRCRGLLRQLDLDEGGELPDPLIALLPAVGLLEESEAAGLARTYLLPAIDKMLNGLAGKENPFESVLLATRSILAELAGSEPARAPAAPFEVLVEIGASAPLMESLP